MTRRKKPTLAEAANLREHVKIRCVPTPDTIARERAAGGRVAVTLAHLNAAHAELYAACADLSTVIGAHDIYHGIKKLADAVESARYELDTAANTVWRGTWRLDHTPSAAELRSGNHGCGRSPRKKAA